MPKRKTQRMQREVRSSHPGQHDSPEIAAAEPICYSVNLRVGHQSGYGLPQRPWLIQNVPAILPFYD